MADNRGDVRRMLLARGWAEERYAVLRKGGACWAGLDGGDSCLSGQPRASRRGFGQWTVDFPAGVPATVVVAACEAAIGAAAPTIPDVAR